MYIYYVPDILTLCMCDSLYSLPAAAEPPTINSVEQDPSNACIINLTWMKPATNFTIDGYVVYWTNGDQGRRTTKDGQLTLMEMLDVNPVEPVYTFYTFTLYTNDALPSKPSPSWEYSET